MILKFGGSVLRDEDTLRGAVHEIHRWRRAGEPVVAVVSAMAGTTDDLLERCRHIDAGSADHAVASVVAGGELSCASLLGLLLERAGVPARVLTPSAIELSAEGPPLDATPVSANVEPIERALARDEVVVVPGFTACDAQGRTVLLGRGGSDLTALFLAWRLGAERCRLVKNIDGLYEHDPGTPGPAPARFATARWEDVLDTDGSVVQHKAVRFAREHGVGFELGRLNGTRPTVIGAEFSVRESERDLARPLRVGLLGFGTVGGGLYDLLAGQPEMFEVVGIAVRDVAAHRRRCGRPELLTTDPYGVVQSAEVVVEALGGVSPALEILRHALEQGRHVVTANKSAVAASGGELARIAEREGVRFFDSAAVGGSMPLLERLRGNGEDVVRVRGVLNGTVNFLLEGLAEGRTPDAILDEARERGFAEQDVERDLSGQDAAEKLVLTADCVGVRLDAEDVRREVVDERTGERALAARDAGCALRQVSSLDFGTERVVARVRLETLEAGDPLFDVRGERNAAVVERADGASERVHGKGAGRWPTAESAMGDLLEIARALDVHARGEKGPIHAH